VRLLGLFAFGLALRLLFQFATPDGGACWHIGFQGDAPVWQDLALRQHHGWLDVELLLPFRPPGMTYGLALLWNGEAATVWPLRLLFAVLGAAVPVLVWRLLHGNVAEPIAFGTALLCAAAGNLLLLSSGLHAETPYLFLVLLSLLDQQRLGRQGLGQQGLGRGAGAFLALRWGTLHGLLCLLRGEHVLTMLMLGAVALAQRVRWHLLLLAAVGAALPLVPWQLHANQLVARFNAGEPQLPPSAVSWQPAALARLRLLPSFQQGPMFRFVSDTMQRRGRDAVEAADLDVIHDAFGCYPEPLRPTFVALQGPMNFWLACTPEGGGGFSGASLDRPPPLLGGADRYPAWLAQDRPRGGKFSLNYPPHLDLFVNGYRRGLDELARDPVGALQRLGDKLWTGLAGATGGLGGHALPIGLSGLRRPVDMVAATGVWPGIWRVLVLLSAVAGWWQLRRVAALQPLLAFTASRALILAAFFGHARFGALCLPAVALGVAATGHTLVGRAGGQRWLGRLSTAAMVSLLAIEAVRAATVVVEVDGREHTQAPGGTASYRPHTITFR
jgi:hypothetical protein